MMFQRQAADEQLTWDRFVLYIFMSVFHFKLNTAINLAVSSDAIPITRRLYYGWVTQHISHCHSSGTVISRQEARFWFWNRTNGQQINERKTQTIFPGCQTFESRYIGAIRYLGNIDKIQLRLRVIPLIPFLFDVTYCELFFINLGMLLFNVRARGCLKNWNIRKRYIKKKYK